MCINVTQNTGVLVLEFEYNLTGGDYVAYNLFVVNNLPVGVKQFQRYRIWLTALVAVACLAFVVIVFDRLVAGLIAAAIGALLAWLLARWSWRRQARSSVVRMAGEDGLGTPGLHRLSLDDEGIREEGPSRVTTATWDRLVRLEQTSEHLFIFTGPVEAFVIPRAVGANKIAKLIGVVKAHRADLVSQVA